MPENNRHSLIAFGSLVFGLLLLKLIGSHFPIDFSSIKHALATLPFLVSGTVFVILYVLLTFFVWFSKDVFRITAAVVFGPYLSTLLVWIAEVINGCLLFTLARLLGRDFVARMLKARYARLDQAITQTGFVWLFLFRAAPLVPFRFFDLSVGLSEIPFRRFFSCIVLGSLPRIFWLQYVLAGVGEGILKNPQAAIDYLSAHPGASMVTLVYLVLIVAVAWKMHTKRSA